MSLLVILYVMALRVADGFANGEDTSRRRTLRDLPLTRSEISEENAGGSSGRPDLIAFEVTEAGA